MMLKYESGDIHVISYSFRDVFSVNAVAEIVKNYLGINDSNERYRVFQPEYGMISLISDNGDELTLFDDTVFSALYSFVKGKKVEFETVFSFNFPVAERLNANCT